ncbi:hypothetical protein VT52_007445 [Streptomyces malaysiense]|uniref:Uncharacterized protein n=1 Tax=Streptomyces malaysiense TaxID=1428626 RepID=A0A1J4Q5Z9_9ACTN|nr:hypothetical protein VT52_007445 [Streptomyces malaysiense]
MRGRAGSRCAELFRLLWALSWALWTAAVGTVVQLLDVDVDQFAGPVAFVAADHVAGGPVGSAASSGHDQRARGTPVSAGSWQTGALASATCTGVKRAGRPLRLRSARADSPPWANRPRQVRTVSMCSPVSRAMRALDRPRAACSTTWARTRSRYSVLRPKAIVCSLLRSAAVGNIGPAVVMGMAGRSALGISPSAPEVGQVLLGEAEIGGGEILLQVIG